MFTRKNVKMGKRVTALVMTLLMVATLLPIWLLNGVFEKTAKADEGTYILDVTTDFTGETIADKNTKSFGTAGTSGKFSVTDGYFRVSSGAVTSIETLKEEGNAISFSTDGTSKVTVKVSSTGGSNYSVVALKNTATGTYVAATSTTGASSTSDPNNKYLYVGSTKCDLVFEDVAPGTYSVVTPSTSTYTNDTTAPASCADTAKKRGIRIYKITVEEGASASSAVDATVATTVTGETSPVFNESDDSYKLTFGWSETSASQAGSKVTIKYLKSGETEYQTLSKAPALGSAGATTADIEMKDIPSGTYTFKVVGGSGESLASSAITWTQPIKAWADVVLPTITAAQVDAKSDVEVTFASAPVFGRIGSDKITLNVKNGDTVLGTKELTKDADLKDSKVTVSIPATTASAASLTIEAVAEREGETDKKTETTTLSDYSRRLVKPVISTITNNGNGAIVLTHSLFDEADKYEVLYREADTVDFTAVDVTAGAGTASFTLPAELLNKSVDFMVKTTRTSTTESIESNVDTRYIKTEASTFKSETVDISGGLVKGTTYGNPSYLTFEVFDNMPSKDNDDAATKADYPKCIQGGANAAPNKGEVPTTGAAFKITAVEDAKIAFNVKAASGKAYHFVGVEGETKSDITDANTPGGKLSFKVKKGNTYYFYLDGSKPVVYEIKISTGTPDVDWANLAAPVITSAVVDSTDDTKLNVNYEAKLGDQGAEEIEIQMMDSTGNVVETQKTDIETKTFLQFTPSASGDYTFKATISREGFEDKVSEVFTKTGFVLPLAQPLLGLPQNHGDGSVTLFWDAVKEADSYKVEYKLKDAAAFTEAGTADKTEYKISGLTQGETYTFKITPVRSSVAGKKSATIDKKITTVSELKWNFSAFGQGVTVDYDNITDKSKSNNGYSGGPYSDDQKTNVWCLNSKGKLVPASTDGLAFYYTAIPSNKNFTISGTATVNKWTYTNGQEGFGLMAADTVGKNGDASVFWNNSYMATATKVEYYSQVNEETGEAKVKNSGDKISMKLGLGSQEKVGVTKDNLEKLIDLDDDAINNQFKSHMKTLETSMLGKEAGTYNIVGNYTNTDATFKDTAVNDLTTFKFTIQRNNTGYFVSYTDAEGNTTTNKYYDTTALDKLDSENVYVGMFASRTCDITYSDITVTTIDPEDDAPAEERPIEYTDVLFSVSSSGSASSEDYKLKGSSNVDGQVVIKKGNAEIATVDVKAGVPFEVDTKLTVGDNKFTLTLTPDSEFKFGDYEVPSSYDPVEISKTVTYAYFTGTLIYVSAEETAAVDEAKAQALIDGVSYNAKAQINAGKGLKSKPIDLYSAVSYAKPGQKILLLDGDYTVKNNVMIPFGIDGTAADNIYLMPATEGTRIVLDCAGTKGEGITVCGNHWYIQNIDVKNSANGKDGIHVCGSYNTLDGVNTYNNGNTGIQISRFSSAQAKEDWPAYNTIKNCTSHDNADSGYEDADGFAAKLTIGKGNVFVGCIAHNNADDGWDLFAKPETGSIPSVVIMNSVAYGNGFLSDGTNAGNGNGFKMGGSSMTGKHVLINSVAFDNKAKGIDSNSCPDNVVISSTSYNNGAPNVALYTNDAKNTAYNTYGILSFRTKYTDVADSLKLKGTQEKDNSNVYKETDYYWLASLGKAKEASSKLSASDFVSTDTKAVAALASVSPITTGETKTLLDAVTPITYPVQPITRNADGTVNMNGLLMLSAEARARVGGGIGADALDAAPVFTSESAAMVIEVLGEEEFNRIKGISVSSAVVSRAGTEGTLTGDSSNINFFLVLMLLAMVGVVGVVVFEKKRRARA